MFPNDTPATACANDANPKAFENFRMAIIQGGRASVRGGRQNFSIERPESIENRLIKLLWYLKPLWPKDHWEQFLNDNGTIKWESIAVAGQSQGGGHAALIGIKHRVARVLCFGAPKDYSNRLKHRQHGMAMPLQHPKTDFSHSTIIRTQKDARRKNC